MGAEVAGSRMIGIISYRSELQERSSTEPCRSSGTGTFPGDAQCAGRLPQFSRARRIDDVLVAARDCPEEHAESRTDLASDRAELVRKPPIRVMAGQRPLNEAKLVVVFDGREADHDISELQIRAETAGRSRTDHGLNGRLLLDQMLS